jgi:molybdate transport system regulatory protein
MAGARLTLRVDFGADRAIGPGKVLLLEAIRDTGSISQAGRSLGMSYRRAWLLVDDMNRCFREPVVTAQPGGAQGGGAALTAFGNKLIRNYRAIETQAMAAIKPQLHDLEAALRSLPRRTRKLRKTSIRARTARR